MQVTGQQDTPSVFTLLALLGELFQFLSFLYLGYEFLGPANDRRPKRWLANLLPVITPVLLGLAPGVVLVPLGDAIAARGVEVMGGTAAFFLSGTLRFSSIVGSLIGLLTGLFVFLSLRDPNIWTRRSQWQRSILGFLAGTLWSFVVPAFFGFRPADAMFVALSGGPLGLISGILWPLAVPNAVRTGKSDATAPEHERATQSSVRRARWGFRAAVTAGLIAGIVDALTLYEPHSATDWLSLADFPVIQGFLTCVPGIVSTSACDPVTTLYNVASYFLATVLLFSGAGVLAGIALVGFVRARKRRDASAVASQPRYRRVAAAAIIGLYALTLALIFVYFFAPQTVNIQEHSDSLSLLFELFLLILVSEGGWLLGDACQTAVRYIRRQSSAASKPSRDTTVWHWLIVAVEALVGAIIAGSEFYLASLESGLLSGLHFVYMSTTYIFTTSAIAQWPLLVGSLTVSFGIGWALNSWLSPARTKPSSSLDIQARAAHTTQRVKRTLQADAPSAPTPLSAFVFWVVVVGGYYFLSAFSMTFTTDPGYTPFDAVILGLTTGLITAPLGALLSVVFGGYIVRYAHAIQGASENGTGNADSSDGKGMDSSNHGNDTASAKGTAGWVGVLFGLAGFAAQWVQPTLTYLHSLFLWLQGPPA